MPEHVAHTKSHAHLLSKKTKVEYLTHTCGPVILDRSEKPDETRETAHIAPQDIEGNAGPFLANSCVRRVIVFFQEGEDELEQFWDS